MLLGQLRARQRVLLQRLAPTGGQPVRLGSQALGQAVCQRRAACLQRLREPLQGVTQRVGRVLAGALVGGQCVGPLGGDLRSGGAELVGHAVQLPAHLGRQRGLQLGAFAAQARQRCFHGGLQRSAGQAGALGGTLRQRALHRRRQPGVGRMGLLIEAALAGLQAFGQRGLLALHRRHAVGDALDQRGQQRGLLLQQPQGGFALVQRGEGAQRGGQQRVEPLGDQQALAAAQGGHQAQHGGRSHAGHRCAEGKAQPPDRRGQRIADGAQAFGACQRSTRAVQRDHHAQKGAHHAQQHQQARQVRHEHRRRQAGARAFDALAHGIAQAVGQRCKPVGQVGGRRGGQGLQHAACGVCAAPVAPQLPRAQQVERRYAERDGQRQRVSGAVAQRHPADGGQAGRERRSAGCRCARCGACTCACRSACRGAFRCCRCA